MTSALLAGFERSGVEPSFAWAVMASDTGVNHADVHALSPDGAPLPKPRRARVEGMMIPSGAPALMVSASGQARVLIVDDGHVTGELGPEPISDGSAVYPIGRAGAVPGGFGPARCGLAAMGRPTAQSARRFALRWALEEYRTVMESDGLFGATWLDVVRVPHQLAAVEHVLGAPSVRHVLADEVGLGKTVEALMIWSALSARSPSLRTLVVAPRSLILQWCIEIRRKAERSPRASRTQDYPPVYVPGTGGDAALEAPNPRGIVVTDPAGLVALREKRRAVDLLIVDEAHTLNDEQRSVVRAVARTAPHVLLLTATPRETRRASGAARRDVNQLAWALSVVDPKIDEGEDVNARLEVDLQRLEDLERRAIAGEVDAASLASEWAPDARLSSDARRDLRALAREGTIMERVVRTRRRQLEAGLTARRVLHRVPVDYRAEEVAVYEALQAVDDELATRLRGAGASGWAALRSSKGAKPSGLRDSLAALDRVTDAKLEALLDLLARLWADDPGRKIVIRCEYADTLDSVARRLEALLGRGALRELSDEQRAAWLERGDDCVGPVAQMRVSQDTIFDALQNPRAIAGSALAHIHAFERADTKGALVLVATDVAARGLNLQFARDLVLYDLPWSAGMTEQWIGRLDRLGQRGAEVSVYAFSHAASPIAPILDLYETLGVFDRGFHGAADIDGQLERMIARADAGELAWDVVQRQASSLLQGVEEDPERGRLLDLPAAATPREVDCSHAGRRLLATVAACGFEVSEAEHGTLALSWPAGRGVDAVELAAVRAALRFEGRTVFGSPEAAAADHEAWGRALRVDVRSLSQERWLRRWSVDFLTPRHPLVVEMREELAMDPTLAVGAFRVQGGTQVPPGRFLVTLRRTFPELGAAQIFWSAISAFPRELGPLGDDPELLRLVDGVRDGLERSFLALTPPTAWSEAWVVRPTTGAIGELLPPDRADAIRSLLPRAVVTGSNEGARILEKLARLEVPPAIDADLWRAARTAAERSARYGQLLGERLLHERQRQRANVAEGSAWRGLQERCDRDVARCSAVLERMAPLPSLSQGGLAEALTPRVVAAAIVEVVA